MSKQTILIDDDNLIHLNWKYYLKNQEVVFRSFYSIDEFLIENKKSQFARDAHFYIDSNLGDNMRGEVASKILYDLGFQMLYLSTGYNKEDIVKPFWIKEVYSKSPIEIFKTTES